MSDLKMPLNATQLEILKLFSQPLNDADLKEIKSLLVKHLSEKISRKIEDITNQKGYTQKNFDSWLNEPNQ
jgi:hypothetical protein